MHELSLVQDILVIAEDYARREGATAIQAIGLRVGAMSGVEPQALEFAFEIGREGTLAQKARLDIELVELRARCEDCQQDFLVDNPFGIASCPICNTPSSQLILGEELSVRYLEVM